MMRGLVAVRLGGLIGALLLVAGTAQATDWAFFGSRYQAMGGTGVAFADDSSAIYWNQSNLAWKKAWDVQLPATVDLAVENKALEELSELVLVGENLSDTIDRALRCLPNCPNQPLTSSDQKKLAAFLYQLGTYGEEGQSVHGNLSFALAGRYNNFGFSVISGTNATLYPNVDLSNLGFAINAVDQILGLTGSATCCEVPQNAALQTDLWNNVPGIQTTFDSEEQVGHLIWLFEQASGNADGSTVEDLVTGIVEGTIGGGGPESPFNQNSTGALVAGVSIQEVGLSYARKVPIPYYSRTEGRTHKALSYLHNRVAVGGTVKYMLGVTFVKTFLYDDPDGLSGLNFLESDVREVSNAGGLDLSFSMRPVDWFHWGFVARNVNGPRFAIARPVRNEDGGISADIKIEPQVRLGTAFMPIENFTFAFDVDLTENKVVTLPGFRSRIVSIGGEYVIPFHRNFDLALRIGGYDNISGDVDSNWAMTGGMGFRMWDFVLDLSVGASFGKERVRTDTTEFVDIPSRLNFGLGLKWEHSL